MKENVALMNISAKIEQKVAVFHSIYARIWAILMPLPKHKRKKATHCAACKVLFITIFLSKVSP